MPVHCHHHRLIGASEPAMGAGAGPDTASQYSCSLLCTSVVKPNEASVLGKQFLEMEKMKLQQPGPRLVSLSEKKSTMSLVQEFMPLSKFKHLTWSPLIWKLDTDSYPGLMGRSFVPIAFAKRHARTIKINTFFVAMVLVFVYWCVRLGYVMERERYEEKLRFGRLFIEVLERRYQIF